MRIAGAISSVAMDGRETPARLPEPSLKASAPRAPVLNPAFFCGRLAGEESCPSLGTAMRTTTAMLLAAAALLGALATTTKAGVQISGTRVVYPASERSVTVNVINDGNDPRLLQVWVDEGDPAETAATTKAPFLVTPPVSRIDPGQGQALRVAFNGTRIAQDRESVYWLNVLEVPPRPRQEDASSDARNFMQLAVRTRIKIFYRPSSLKGDPIATLGRLQWRVVKQESEYLLECTNPTGFNASFNSVGLKGQVQESQVEGGGMCPALGSAVFKLDPSRITASQGVVVFSAINDWGGFIAREATFTP